MASASHVVRVRLDLLLQDRRCLRHPNRTLEVGRNLRWALSTELPINLAWVVCHPTYRARLACRENGAPRPGEVGPQPPNPWQSQGFGGQPRIPAPIRGPEFRNPFALRSETSAAIQSNAGRTRDIVRWPTGRQWLAAHTMKSLQPAMSRQFKKRSVASQTSVARSMV